MNPLRRVPVLRALDGETRPIARVRRARNLNLSLLPLDDGEVEEPQPSRARYLSSIADRLRTSRQKHAKEGFQGNQSVPATFCRVTMDRLKGDGMSTHSFSGNYHRGNSLHQSQRLGTSVNESANAQTNPSTAIFTLDINTNNILMVNARACDLLGYTSEEFSVMTFVDLIQDDKHRAKVLALGGSSSMFNGKVMEFRSKADNIIPVFMWLKLLEGDGRCLAMAEPVQRRTAKIIMDSRANIQLADSESSLLFQCEESDMKGRNLRDLIPSFSETEVDLDDVQDNLMKKQMHSGVTVETRRAFPLLLRVIKNDDSTYTSVIWVFENLSGLIVINKKGLIESCNHQFTHMMFGYTQAELIGQSISTIIPEFCKNMTFCDSINSTLATPYESAAGSDLDISGQSSSVTSDCYDNVDKVFSKCDEDKIWPPQSLGLEAEQVEDDTPTVSPQNLDDSLELADDDRDVVWIPVPDTSDDLDDFVSADGTDDGISLDGEENDRTPVALVTSTPRHKSHSSSKRATDDLLGDQSPEVKRGLYAGNGLHRDGFKLDISYRVRAVPLMSGSVQYLVWVSLDAVDRPCNKDLEAATSSSVGESVRSDSVSSAVMQGRAESMASVPNEQLTNGAYGVSYTNLKQIGKGAHGFVYLAYQHSDQRLVVTKFISKLNTLPSALTVDVNLKKIPLEIEILTKLQHVNIVKVLQVYENDNFYTIVMEKHGPGMDLFEFIDRRPTLDEPLISYIFRQIAFALDYLHSHSILHRDIKDENVIIDQHFNVKLIDFGSATYLEDGHLFSTFFGTVEYCSPEVLAGNKYAGPELEMWSLGVTLYIMVFGENPFFDVEETLRGEFLPPSPISDELMLLLQWMLAKDVSKRCKVDQLVKHNWINQRVDISKYSFADVVACTIYEANPPIFYSEYCPDVTNSSWSFHEESNSNSMGSLTTVENFDSEEVRQETNYDDDEFPELSDDSDESYKDPENFS